MELFGNWPSQLSIETQKELLNLDDSPRKCAYQAFIIQNLGVFDSWNGYENTICNLLTNWKLAVC